MNKVEMITKIIFKEDNLSKVKFPVNEEIKQHFEIAWDIAENFGKIRESIKKILISKLMENLKEKYPNFEIINAGFIEGEKYGGLLLFPKNWPIIENKKPLLSYGLEWETRNYFDLIYGIEKFNNEIPYKGRKVPENLNKLFQIQKRMEGNFKKSDYWVIYKYFNEPYGCMCKKEFFDKILTEGIDKVTDYYIKQLDKLITETKDDLNKFIEKYKKSLS
jgi:hypothetical protein